MWLQWFSVQCAFEVDYARKNMEFVYCISSILKSKWVLKYLVDYIVFRLCASYLKTHNVLIWLIWVFEKQNFSLQIRLINLIRQNEKNTNVY